MAEFDLKVGLSAWVETSVIQKNTAAEFESGSIDVFATPAMVAIMEKAALTAVEPHLPAGYSTVGTSVNITHSAASPVGIGVRAYAELTGVEGKRLYFKVEAYDQKEKIGEGQHERYIVNEEKFRSKAYAKLNPEL